MMRREQSEILAVLLDVKEKNSLTISDELIKSCYELQKRHQFDPDAERVVAMLKMREFVEKSLEQDDEDK